MATTCTEWRHGHAEPLPNSQRRDGKPCNPHPPRVDCQPLFLLDNRLPPLSLTCVIPTLRSQSTLVIDNGGGRIKAGFAGEPEPRWCVSARDLPRCAHCCAPYASCAAPPVLCDCHVLLAPVLWLLVPSGARSKCSLCVLVAGAGSCPTALPRSRTSCVFSSPMKPSRK